MLDMNNKPDHATVQDLMDQIRKGPENIECIGLTGSDHAYLVSRINIQLKVPVLVVVGSSKQGEKFFEDVTFFSKNHNPSILYFPSYNLLPFKTISYHNETVTVRIRTLFQLLINEAPPVIITTVGAMMHKLVPKKEINDYAELIMTGEDIERDRLIEKMITGGYVRTGIVEEPGDFSVRGGILDIFSPLYQDPLRIELFGDTVESIRFFSALSQRKLKTIWEAVILPAKEVILKKASLARIIARIREQASNLEIPVTRAREIIDRISKEGIFPGIESLIPIIYHKLDTLSDYLPDSTVFIQVEPEELNIAAHEYESLVQQNYNAACEEKRLCVEPHRLYMNWTEIKANLQGKKTLFFQPFSILKPEAQKDQRLLRYEFLIEDNTVVIENLKHSKGRENALLPLSTWVKAHQKAGYATVVVSGGKSQANRIKSLLTLYDIKAGIVTDFSETDLKRDLVYICIGQIVSGFVWADEALAVITEDEIFGKKYQRLRRSKPQVRNDLIPIEDLKKEDLVVHAEHGIGRYGGLTKLKLNGSTNDFLLILYKDNDKLYLPVDRMSLIQKYMGVDSIIPVLDKLGGKSWDRVKAKVKKSTEKIAGELLKLYAERNAKAGFAFQSMDEFYQGFEAGFPYEETEDQIKAIENVLQDMMAPTSMDRLVCGDVGYGKTEVALRASFIAVNNGKQVAVLVPTTVLAEQHFSTFSSRFEPYPVNMACLSRFRSVKEQREIINGLKSGKIDIVIGTHRLLQKDVGFKELGLFILDEEQRFGVKHKEKLKKIRSTVDVLALTATPIPRTLHMSLLGIRDISVISTPPEYRRAIITYVSEFNDAVVAEAIRKELNRNGQIFFVHNNINSIHRMAGKIAKLVPGIRMEIAHGRMKEDELEKVMLRFLRREIDLLVCTTIIESGLDIPSANTILVNRADKFGLAQIYQLRGRVGRADEQAYAYLFIPRESALGKDAQKRLKVLMEHSDLGSGFQIAMSDLKIRGGGTLLGASQSGHIASVGYDMFLKLMEESIAEIKGEPIQDFLEPEINVVISAFIPESYISDIDQRLSAYRRLAKMTDLNEISDFKTELMDRFGSLPSETTSLLMKIMLKVLSRKAGVKRLDLTHQELKLYFSESHQQHPFGLVDMIASGKTRFQITPDQILIAGLSNRNISGLLVEIKNILQEISRHVNPNLL